MTTISEMVNGKVVSRVDTTWDETWAEALARGARGEGPATMPDGYAPQQAEAHWGTAPFGTVYPFPR